MNVRKHLTLATKANVLACLLAVTAFLAGSCQGRAQASTSQSTSGSLETLAGHTPLQVLNGVATRIGTYEQTKKLRLVIGLQHPNLAGEEAFLQELQTKGSPNFQKFLTPEEWNSRFSPSAADEQAVVDWAASQGLTITQRYPNRLLVDVEGDVATIQKTFGVTINAYQVGSRVTYSNDRDPIIPARLSNIIHSMGGLNSIQVLRPANTSLPEPAFADYAEGPVSAAGPVGGANAKAKRPSTGDGPKPNITGGAYDPTDIYSSQAYDVNALYNQGHCCNPLNNSGVTPPSSSIAIATAGTQSTSDFAGLQSTYPYLAYHYQQYYIDGTPTCCDGEGTEDFDWSTAWSNSFGSYVNTAMVYMYDGVNANFSTFTDVYNAIYTGGHAKVFTTSWGCEETYCTPNSVMDTDHGIFNSMIGTGMTLMAATGDQGATAGCGDRVAVQYPASDPNIVGAGGNTLRLDSSSNFLSEVAWSGGPYGCASNDGGSTGGASSYYSMPGYQNGAIGGTQRYVPDIALNADWYYTPQNIYSGGGLQGNGGTSIVAPSLAGFFAQVNAYLDYVATINGGCYGGTTCSAIGNGNWYLYYFGLNPNYAPHYPFYDITSGCNNNNYTAYYGLGYYCAGTGYDAVTGWGSFNALQLARAITTYRASYGSTAASFSGYTQPVVNQWYNTDQAVQFTISGTGYGYPSTGVAGFSDDWDNYIYDSSTAARPATGDSFFAGVEYPNATYGYLYVSWAGQGCHTAQIRSWDNSGGGGYNTYGPICYDTVVPTISVSNSPAPNGNGWWRTNVNVTLSPADDDSGVKATYYTVDSYCDTSNLGACNLYSGPFAFSTEGIHYIYYVTEDYAGNFSAEPYEYVYIDKHAPVTTPAYSGTLYSGSTYKSPVQITLNASDGSIGSGVYKTWYSLDGATVLHYVSPFTVTAVGSHSLKYWSTDYAGNSEAQTTVSFTVVSASATTTTLAATPNPSLLSHAVTMMATVTGTLGGTPTGSVTFWHGATNLGTVALSSGVASLSTSSLPAGNNSLSASYSGDSNYASSSSAAYTQTVMTKAVLSTPAPSSMLTGSTITFTWSSAPGATAYGFRLGTSVGAANLYTSGLIAGTSTTSTTVPMNGSTVYARLYTAFGATQIYNDYTYTTAIKSKVTSPTPSSVLTGPKVTFNWSAATGGATGYIFKLGTTVGANNLYGSGTTTSTTAAVSGLPTDGSTVYARLYTNWGAHQAYTDYVYTAATKGAITAPAPSSTLSGASVTFTWSAATGGATGYGFRLGTSVGAANLYSSGTITATSATASGLPTNGSTIYARLYTNYGSNQVYTDYIYTAAP
jgi:hypothetical protein